MFIGNEEEIKKCANELQFNISEFEIINEPVENETVKIAEISKCHVIISGGVSSINDIKKAKRLNNKNIEGIIVGKAIYDGDIKLEELAKELDA